MSEKRIVRFHGHCAAADDGTFAFVLVISNLPTEAAAHEVSDKLRDLIINNVKQLGLKETQHTTH